MPVKFIELKGALLQKGVRHFLFQLTEQITLPNLIIALKKWLI